ncbi:MAG: hypothetical protein RID09_04380 [Coleofasciculus sp. G1-WW12-02]|uniref:hypothetical protein n=1 Tax=unclassified Coleofasciculus TaxID=2692782 RepID=UPI0032FA1ED6
MESRLDGKGNPTSTYWSLIQIQATSVYLIVPLALGRSVAIASPILIVANLDYAPSVPRR